MVWEFSIEEGMVRAATKLCALFEVKSSEGDKDRELELGADLASDIRELLASLVAKPL